MKHYSVLLQESIEALAIKKDGIYVDATLGRGGHSSQILKQLNEKGHLYAFDQDEDAIKESRVLLESIGKNHTIIHDNFKNLTQYIHGPIDGILFDLGVSSPQFDEGNRGFSYRYDDHLDMRMDQRQTLDAYQIVNTYSIEQMTKIFQEYGEEKFSYKIACMIDKARSKKTIETTFELVEIIKSALPSAVKRKEKHPAKQVFQALRIAVNDELTVLKETLNDALDLLKVDGRCVVITFHSLEDRIVKIAFNERSKFQETLPKNLPIIVDKSMDYELIFKKPIVATKTELDENKRSHSAKLRAIKRLK